MKLKVLSLLVCALGLVFVSSAMAQNFTVSGTITAADDGNPLPNVTVIYKGTNIGTATDIDGHYELNVPSENGTLVFSSIGFKKQEILINGRSTIDVVLETSVAELNEVVVTGYGDIEKKSYTGSVAKVSSDQLQDIPVASVDQALQGNVAGAVISPSTGTPGAVQEIRIRGLSSINAGVSPLFVIDGVPVVSGTNASSTSTSSLGVLANLSPSDIESITILKDAVSTAPYGARGANGVVVITTKSGRPGTVTYSVSAQRGFNNRAVAGPGAMNATQWDNMYYAAAGNYLDALGYPSDRGTVDAVFGSDGWDGSTNTNWGNVVRNDNAIQQQYDLSARGGNQNTTFYTSANYFQQEGQIIGSKLDRVSGKLNISHKLDETVTIKNDFTGSYVTQDGILEGAGYFGSPVLAQYFMQPIDAAFNSDGTPNISNLSTNIFNPVYIQNNDIDRKRNYRLINNTNVDIQILNNLSFTTNFAIDYILTEEKYYNNPFYGDGADTRGSVDDINNRNFTYVWRNILKYVWTANEDNVFNFRAVTESQRNYSDYLESYGEGIAAGGLYNLNTVATPQFVGSSTTDWAVQSFTGLVNYGYKDKAFVDASLRYEGNSRFSNKKRWGTFWSVGLGYLLSDEDFLKDVSWLDLLKVRTSYGKTGNASIGLNQYQALVGFGGYNDQPDIQPSQLGNNNLTWEKATSIDVGLEFGVFKKLTGSVTLFRKNSKDLLFDVPLSYSTGHASQLQNSGKLYNKGIEVELNADVIRNNHFAWSLGGNFTALKNEVTSLPTDLNGNPIEITTSTRYRAVEGYAVDAWYTKEWAGVDPQN
ncbi:MAG TPA: SusC/RagA family TonB-linked outer membrane protein, partial [Balneolaceae bacterium]|nr:SusC/RagA family TonB-linked outer membrane protein [Balneolaceae bacterium]